MALAISLRGRGKKLKNGLYLGFIAAALAILIVPATTFAQQGPTEVREVIMINAQNADEPFGPLFTRYSAVYAQYKSKGVRELWFSGYAGQQTGLNIVTITYPDMNAFAAGGNVISSPEYQALSQEFQQKGFRVVSRSLSFRAQ